MSKASESPDKLQDALQQATAGLEFLKELQQQEQAEQEARAASDGLQAALDHECPRKELAGAFRALQEACSRAGLEPDADLIQRAQQRLDQLRQVARRRRRRAATIAASVLLVAAAATAGGLYWLQQQRLSRGAEEQRSEQRSEERPRVADAPLPPGETEPELVKEPESDLSAESRPPLQPPPLQPPPATADAQQSEPDAERPASPVQSSQERSEEASAFRTWTSADGKFQVVAKFVRLAEKEVHIQREKDGKAIRVPLEKLSSDDQQFLRSRTPE